MGFVRIKWEKGFWLIKTCLVSGLDCFGFECVEGLMILGGLMLGLSITETLEVSGSVLWLVLSSRDPKGSSPFHVVVVVETPRPKGSSLTLLLLLFGFGRRPLWSVWLGWLV